MKKGAHHPLWYAPHDIRKAPQIHGMPLKPPHHLPPFFGSAVAAANSASAAFQFTTLNHAAT